MPRKQPTNGSLDPKMLLNVLTAIKKGDFSVRLPLDWTGIGGKIADTLNDIVELNDKVSRELDRMSKVVGKEGKLTERASFGSVGGAWAHTEDSINALVGDLARPTMEMARVIGAVAKGDLTQVMTLEIDGKPLQGEFMRTSEIVNTMVDQLSAFASEVTRVAREVGTDGKLGGQAQVKGVAGIWKDLTDNVNQMASNLTSQVRNIAEVTTAVAKGNLSKKITVDARGEILELKNTINTMVDQLSAFASEVTRVAREVGTEGKLGGQAQVRDVAGTWKDLTDNVNQMASNLTNQVRGIAKVVTAVANGDLKKKLMVEAKGEIAELADTINNMIDTLAIFADQVTSVAREVGSEGKLGGQANVPGAAGIWKDLTDNVNQLAANLTTQVRAIADVVTAVTEGDLTRSITVEARAEVEELKNNINKMIRTLRDTTQKNSEQDWLKTNLAKFTRMLQGQRNLLSVSQLLLSELAPVVNAQQGVFYVMENQDGAAESSVKDQQLKMLASYAYKERKNLATTFKMGEGLVGQCAFEKERILLTNVPKDYIQIGSGLGEAPPLSIVVLPIVFEGQAKAVIELASFERFSQTHLAFLEQLTESIGIVLNTIEATMRTEDLLAKSQSLARELQSRQEELQRSNAELEEKARLLVEQKVEVERKNKDVEQARLALEEKAKQLELTSKYKSEFLANMSHELRTPLNSLLILSRQLADNPDGNLTSRQVEFADTIHVSGIDLLNLINDILDLAKIESGTVTVDVEDVRFSDVRDEVARTFRHVAEEKKLEFDVELDPKLPTTIRTDRKRLQQVLKNLLSNAFKFTEEGGVRLRMDVAKSGWSTDHELLNHSKTVVSFSARDTGVGIPDDKHRIIFESFQQAEGGTTRKYSGTGLGLSISREIAILLGGELRLTESSLGKGSTFTLYLPENCPSPKTRKRGEDIRTNSLGEGMPKDGNSQSTPAGSSVADPAPSNPPLAQTLAQGTLSSSHDRISDDRNEIGHGDRILLIVGEDSESSQSLLEAAREKGFKGIVALGDDGAFRSVKEFTPDAILLDLSPPDIYGLSFLDCLKLSPDTRHIPICVISADEEDGCLALERGAFSYLTKPATKEGLEGAFDNLGDFLETRARNLLVVEGDEARRQAIIELVGNGDASITALGTGAETLAALRSRLFDCIVLDLTLPDISGFGLLEEIQKLPGLPSLPVILYTERAFTEEEETKLKKLRRSIIVKSVGSPERLLDETSLFLHRAVSCLPEPKRKMLEKLYQEDSSLAGKKILIVDDDVRNIFALASVFERHNMEVFSAENSKDGIEALRKTPDIDVVLMDIMMPEMDGYDAIRVIRKMPYFKSLPIIAVTAKAMKEDREKCLEAGASDYLAKPVNTDQLVSLIRVWLSRRLRERRGSTDLILRELG
jgi:signal transduction histidine kinase/CheY-like chemotaxis protein/HAMP domain-containing protein